jgi:hypothetical protein
MTRAHRSTPTTTAWSSPSGKGASGTIRESLRGVLDRVRDWPADKPLLDAASEKRQRKALETTAHQRGRSCT